MPDAAPEYGPGCPGCTPDLISKRMERFPHAHPCCRACLDRGALYHAQIKKRAGEPIEDVEKAQEARGESAQG